MSITFGVRKEGAYTGIFLLLAGEQA